jgi:hypothetical protein
MTTTFARPRIAGIAPRTTTGRAPLLSLVMATGPIGAALLLAALSLGNATTTDLPASGAGVKLTLQTSGLLADEPFAYAEPMRTFEDRFELDPLAPTNGVVYAEVGEHGLDVGLRDHKGWEGYFAVTHDFYPANAVFHTDMAAVPPIVYSGGIGEAVFAVQTGSTKITSDVNFVAVNTYTKDGTLIWQVGYSEGKYANARRRPIADVKEFPASLVPDKPVGVTVQTDGYATLKVYLDDVRIVDATGLGMFMEPPLQAYLEVQARDIPYMSRFTNFWVTASEVFTVKGLPPGTKVRLGEGSAPIATGEADRNGTARLTLPLPKAHGLAPVAVQIPGEAGWREISDRFTYSGGDVYTAQVDEGR